MRIFWWYWLVALAVIMMIGSVEAQEIEKMDMMDIKIDMERAGMIGIENNGKELMIVSKDFDVSNGVSMKDMYSWESRETTVRAYIKDEDKLEYDVILKERPRKNELEFEIKYSKDLEFNWQGDYKEDGLGINDFRPENVIHSYAVYKGNRKFFHIYRPLITDSMGNSIWGEMKIEEDILTVEIDEEWLEKAIYPVTVDPTVGYTSVGGTSSSWTSSYMVCTNITDEILGGSVDTLHHYVDDLGTSSDYDICLYNSAGKLIARADQHITNGMAAQWLSNTTEYAIGMNPGEDVWICNYPSSASRYVFYDTGTVRYRYISGGLCSSDTTAFGSGSGYRTHSAYMIYSVSAVPTITISFPGNTTYNATSSYFNITTSIPSIECNYTIDGGDNITMSNTSTTSWWDYNGSMDGSDVMYHVEFYCLNSTGDGLGYNDIWFNLNVTSQSCGDGECNGTENCGTCETDCGECQESCGAVLFFDGGEDWTHSTNCGAGHPWDTCTASGSYIQSFDDAYNDPVNGSYFIAMWDIDSGDLANSYLEVDVDTTSCSDLWLVFNTSTGLGNDGSGEACWAYLDGVEVFDSYDAGAGSGAWYDNSWHLFEYNASNYIAIDTTLKITGMPTYTRDYDEWCDWDDVKLECRDPCDEEPPANTTDVNILERGWVCPGETGYLCLDGGSC